MTNKDNKEEPKEEEIIEGIILDVDYGYGMKYKDQENLYLKLEVQAFDGHKYIQLLKKEKIAKILLQFKGNYTTENSLNSCLMHQNIYLLSSDKTNTIPNAIAKMPPQVYPQYTWIYNDNWN